MRFVLFAAFFAVSVAAQFSSIGYKSCKSEAEIVDVKADGCEQITKNGKNVCVFKVGSEPKIRITFKSAKSGDTLKTNIRAKVGSDAMVEFPQADSNACKYGLTCPLVAGAEQTFEQSIAITPQHPKDQIIQVNWQLVRDDGGKEVCIIFLAEVRD